MEDTQKYINKVTASDEAFNSAFIDYIGKDEYNNIKETTLELIRKQEFASYIIFLQESISKK